MESQCKEKTDFAGTCREVKSPRQVEEVDPIVECLAAIHSEENEKTVDELWLVDSGATVSITPDERGMINKAPSNQRDIVGDRSITNAECIGELLFLLDGGMTMRISAIYVPGFDRHVLSVDSLIKKGSKIEMNSNGARLISEASGKVVNLVKDEQGLSYLRVKRVVEGEKKVQFGNPALVEESDSDDDAPRALQCQGTRKCQVGLNLHTEMR
jgi:hypothetical protein